MCMHETAAEKKTRKREDQDKALALQLTGGDTELVDVAFHLKQSQTNHFLVCVPKQ